MPKPTKPTLAARARAVLANGYFHPTPGDSRVYVICPNGCGQVEAFMDLPFGARTATKALHKALVEHLRWDAAEQAQGDRS